MPLAHHELCFGCGQVNVFGLLLDAQRRADGTVVGRWFAKQDHQGPTRGRAHPGIVACALVEAMLLAGGEGALLDRIELQLEPGGAVAIGTFCDVEARVDTGCDAGMRAQSTATVAGVQVARAKANLRAAGAGGSLD